MYAYDQQYVDRVLPGVRIGTVDLSGLDEAAPPRPCTAAYGSLARARSSLTSPDGRPPSATPTSVAGRMSTAMVAEALAVGRERQRRRSRVIADARTAIRGVDPRAARHLRRRRPGRADRRPSRVARSGARSTRSATNGRGQVRPRIAGRRRPRGRPVDRSPATALAEVAELDAPAPSSLPSRSDARAAITTVEASDAKIAAERVAAEDRADRRGPGAIDLGEDACAVWITFAPTADGGYAADDGHRASPAVAQEAGEEDRPDAPINASFKTSGGRITGVTSSKTGYKTDVTATVARSEALIAARAGGAATASIEPALKVTAAGADDGRGQGGPARRCAGSRPGRRTSRSAIKNGFGANIWIPAKLINGYVVAPRATFDFWDAVGTVSRAKGYKRRRRHHQRPDRAAGRARGRRSARARRRCSTPPSAPGYKMGARRNHYYYIDRYPLGLDATVFKSARARTQTMSFTNDTDYPILIRGINTRNGSKGYVRFDIYSVPTGRKVAFSTPEGPEPQARRRRGPAHVHASGRHQRAHRVPGRRVAGLGHPDRPRQERQGHPPARPTTRTTRASPASSSSARARRTATASRARSGGLARLVRRRRLRAERPGRAERLDGRTVVAGLDQDRLAVGAQGRARRVRRLE